MYVSVFECGVQCVPFILSYYETCIHFFHKVTLKLMTGNKSLCLYAGVVRFFLFFFSEAGFGIAMVKYGGNEI